MNFWHSIPTLKVFLINYFVDFIYLFFWWRLEFELRASHLESRYSTACPTPLVILLWLFWRWDLVDCLRRPASNLGPLDLSLPSSLDYRREPLAPGHILLILTMHTYGFLLF
jgi:hypothetical protein